MNTENLLSSIIDGNTERAKELFDEIMKEKILNRIDSIRDEVGFSLFNKDEFVTEDWSEDDVYLTLGKFANAIDDIETLSEEWDDLPEEEREPVTQEDDDWYFDDDEDVIQESKRHLVRYNEQYHSLLEEYKNDVMESLKMRVHTFEFDKLNENVKPFALRVLSRRAEEVYDAIANLSEDVDTTAEIITEMFMNIFPLTEELSLVPLPAGYTPKKKESRSEYDANRAMSQKAKLTTKPIKPVKVNEGGFFGETLVGKDDNGTHTVWKRKIGSHHRKVVSIHNSADEAAKAAWKHAIKHDTDGPYGESDEHDDAIDRHAPKE